MSFISDLWIPYIGTIPDTSLLKAAGQFPAERLAFSFCLIASLVSSGQFLWFLIKVMLLMGTSYSLTSRDTWIVAKIDEEGNNFSLEQLSAFWSENHLDGSVALALASANDSSSGLNSVCNPYLKGGHWELQNDVNFILILSFFIY